MRTTYDSLVADLVVAGKDLTGEEWRLSGLGMRLVVVKKLLARRPAPAPAVRVTPVAPLPALRRPLSGLEKVSWAEKARGSDPALMQVEAGEPTPAQSSASSSVAPSCAPGVPSVATPADDDEIPVRRRPRVKAPAISPGAPSSSPSRRTPIAVKPAPSAPTSIAPRRRGDIKTYLAPVAAPSPAPCPPASTPARSTTALEPCAPSEGLTSLAGIDVARFDALLAQVERLTQALTEQQQANADLQKRLQAALDDSADLRFRLRTFSSKRSRSADTKVGRTSQEHSGSDTAMSSAEEEPASRRRSPGRDSPPNV